MYCFCKWAQYEEIIFSTCRKSNLIGLFLDFKFHHCNVCGRGYKSRSHLNSHVRYECGKKPLFQCATCGKLFHQKSNLRTHLQRIHDGGKPFIDLATLSMNYFWSFFAWKSVVMYELYVTSLWFYFLCVCNGIFFKIML